MLNEIISKSKNFFKTFYIFIVIAVIYVPLIFIVVLSFTEPSSKGNVNINFDDFTFGNYLDIFQDNDFLDAFFNSFIVAIIVTPVSLIIAIFTCIGMWYSKQKNKKIIMNSVRVNIALPDIVTGMMLGILFFSTWISLGYKLGYATIVLSHISFCTPYAIVAIYPKISKMNINLIYASMDLGHSRLSTYFKFVIPYLKTAIIVAAIIVITLSFDDFIITTLVNGNYETMGTEIFGSRKGIKAWIVTFGAILVLTMILIVTSIIIYNFLKKKRKGSIKNEKNNKNNYIN